MTPEKDVAVPLRPEYALTTRELNGPRPVVNHAPEQYNKEKARLPEHCWLCVHFTGCTGRHKCRRLLACG